MSSCTEAGHLYPLGLRATDILYHLEQHDPHLLVSLCLLLGQDFRYREGPHPTRISYVYFLKITISSSHFGGQQVFKAGYLNSKAFGSSVLALASIFDHLSFI